jgi:hypothetical protein
VEYVVLPAQFFMGHELIMTKGQRLSETGLVKTLEEVHQ